MTIPTSPVSMFRLYNKGYGWLTFFALPFAIVFTLIAMVEGRKYERLDSDGAVAEAVITDKDYEVRIDSDGDRTTTYYLEFDFTAQGQSYQIRDSVGRSFWNGLQPGETTPVRYWRPDPEVNEIEPGATRKSIWITKILAVIVLSLAGVWAERCWRKAARARKVRDHGKRHRVTVTDHFQTSVKVNNRPRWRLEWQDPSGRVGRSYMYRKEVLNTYPVGSEITIFVDPRGRLPSVWEGDVGPRKIVGAVSR